jgi:hypothetical protein
MEFFCALNGRSHRKRELLLIFPESRERVVSHCFFKAGKRSIVPQRWLHLARISSVGNFVLRQTQILRSKVTHFKVDSSSLERVDVAEKCAQLLPSARASQSAGQKVKIKVKWAYQGGCQPRKSAFSTLDLNNDACFHSLKRNRCESWKASFLANL